MPVTDVSTVIVPPSWSTSPTTALAESVPVSWSTAAVSVPVSVAVPPVCLKVAPSTSLASSVPSVCSTFALIFTVDVTVPAVLRFAAVTVGAVSEPPVFTSTSLPVAVSDVAAVTVPPSVPPDWNVSVEAFSVFPAPCDSALSNVTLSEVEAVSPPVRFASPFTRRVPSLAFSVPPDCVRVPFIVP